MNLRSSAIWPSDMRVLIAIVQLKRQGKVITLRAICDYVGYHSVSYPARSVQRLRSLGLVTFEVNEHMRICGGTIQPTCEMVPASGLASQ